MQARSYLDEEEPTRSGLGGEREEESTENHESSDDDSERPSFGDTSSFSSLMPEGVQYSQAALNMMRKQGYEGGGLGRHGEGRSEPILPDANNNRGGLDYRAKPPATIPDCKRGQHRCPEERARDVSVGNRDRNPVPWLRTETYDPQFKYDSALRVGKEVYDYDKFCSSKRVGDLFECKDKLESVPKQAFLDARRRANPYEIIGKSIFINRAAVKLANLDYLCRDLVPTDSGKFFFSDVCAGPGGFTEYVLWRRYGLHSRGWGMTLKGDDDWKFYKFNEKSDVNGRFEAIYGPTRDGNVYKSENIREFQRNVLEGTDGKGIQLFTADGGFCVDGNENYQEVEVKRLVLDQFLCGICALGKGGHFVCKIFDVFTPFTVGLLFILRQHFEEFAIVKPVTSRPANSERYVVCKGFLQQNPSVIEYLFRVNEQFDLKSNDDDVIQVVDPELIAQDTAFLDHIRSTNLQIIDAQIDALNELVMYIEDSLLSPYVDQVLVEKSALDRWRIPNPRSFPNYRNNRGRGRGGRGRGGHHRGGPPRYQQSYDRRRPDFQREEPDPKRRR